ncbi:ABC transporter ATP-binding protein [Halegenticoccus tardaugens]|uniref:ABC transporter ATP-binding protein n=1 Tax=Halegenticoccus tardaugens TaxID=2071624 RepID=UPI00100A5DED|nr:ABC transporter ATP-binding protein [Halegenticoccus tardaugens]
MTAETQYKAERESPVVEADAAGVTLSNLRKEYGDVVAVNGLSLDVEPGEFLVLLGPSGCGKSTTLRMIAGLETPTSGAVEIGEDDVTRTLPQKRDLSMVFQSYALYPHKTVRENLAFPLGKMEVGDDEKGRKIEETARLLEIDELLEKKPGQLSGGQRQRVAVGRTIIREPKAFLMDEPLSNLDARLRVNTRFEIRDLQQQLGTTTIYVTHDQEEAMSVADRIAIMEGGKLQQVGTPKEVYTEPNNEFVAGFIGNPPMNFFDVAPGPSIAFGETTTPHELEMTLPETAERAGIRPEHVHLPKYDTGRDGSHTRDLTEPFASEVAVVEPLGNAYEIEFAREETSFVARLRSLPEGVSTGSNVEVAFDRDELHAFDADGEAIR